MLSRPVFRAQSLSTVYVYGDRFQMMMNFRQLLLLLVAAVTVSGQTNLSGSIGGMILTREGNPFVVSEDIVIPAGKKVTMREGCVILFQPFTGVVVDGSLVVEGTAERPVVFTSVNDTVYGTGRDKKPEPFDWNGIHLKQRARNVRFSHFVLTYSVYGIKSQIDDVVLSRGVFANNGQYHFTVNDVIEPVVEYLPYSYNNEPGSDTLQSKPGRAAGGWRRPLSIAVMAAGLACGGGGAGYSYYRERGFRTLYYNDENSPAEFDQYYEGRQRWRNYAVIAGSAGGALLVAGVALFVYDYLTGKQIAVSVVPFFGSESGFCISIPVGGAGR